MKFIQFSIVLPISLDVLLRLFFVSFNFSFLGRPHRRKIYQSDDRERYPKKRGRKH